MTQEDKLKEAKRLYQTANADQKYVLERLFPELKESEDEKIRKALIKLVKKAGEGYENVIDGVSIDNAISWLEKQGEQKPAVDTKVIIPKFRVGDIVKSKSQPMLSPRIIKIIDKDCYWCKDNGCIGFAWESDYELVEQKPADKVEPKFREGEWLVHKDLVGVTCCITQIHAPYYYLTNKNSFIKFGEEDNYHPWTIQDAKEGDVLVSSSGKPFIFKGFFDNDPMAYGGLVADDSFWPASNSNWTTVYCKPATKEQSDTLFVKMKEAGYEWDGEKKELKRIEQKPFNNQFTPEQASVLDKHIDKLLNPVWSEEDEKVIHCLEYTVRHYYEDKDTVKWCCDWLKSLKGRVQPKQEWNKDDEYYRNIILYILNNECVGKTDKEKAINWLKSLRPQSTWKPSEGQLECLGYAIEKAEKDWSPLTNNRIHLTLKALKEQLEKF